MIRSLALATDLMVRSDVSELVSKGHYTILRTPQEPDFWFGNAILLHLPPKSETADDLIALSRAAFPNAAHVCLQWDVPDMSLPQEIVADLTLQGFDVDVSDTLVLNEPLARPALPDGLRVAALATENDWAQSLALGMEIAVEDGYDPVLHRPYLAQSVEGQRRRIRDGRGAWFGVFAGDLLVAQMGVFHDGKLIRYQQVETRATHRRGGICAALLGHAGAWAMGRAPDAKVVIVADADGPAGRIYRRSGFALVEKLTSAVNGAYAPGFSAAVT